MLTAAVAECIGSSGPGGWAWCADAAHAFATGAAQQTTPARIRLRVIYEVLRHAPHDEPLTVVFDDPYSLELATGVDHWKSANWCDTGGRRLANIDLIRAIDAERAGRHVEFKLSRDGQHEDLVDRARRSAHVESQKAAALWLRESKSFR